MNGWTASGGITTAEREKLTKIAVEIKSNLNATAPPTVDDDEKAGYSANSKWEANGISYLCADPKNPAVWLPTSDMYYFDTWALLIAAISVIGSTYSNKFATVSNANGGPSGGTTYTAPGPVINPIVDGGSAIYKINVQGTLYSVSTQVRTITNPVVTSVMLVPNLKPTTAGYYIFAVTPTDGLPTGIAINDIVHFDGIKWSVWQTYAAANTVLVIGTTSNTQITWRKFNGTWMSTADEFNTDGKEYQTGKLWNGKAVFRRGTSGTTNSSGTTLVTSIGRPLTGKQVSIWAEIKRSDNNTTQVSASGNEILLDTNGSTGLAEIWAGSTIYQGRPFDMWIEYTKS